MQDNQRITEMTTDDMLLARERAARVEAEFAYQRLRDLLMQAPAAICLLHGPEHVYEFANPLYLQVIGYRNPIGKPIREALPELEGQGIFELLDRVYLTGEPFTGNEVRIELDRGHDGKRDEAYFNFVYQPARNVHGEVNGIMVHAVEVTEQVHARQKIQESEVRLRRLVDSNIVGVSFTNLQGAVLDANDNFLRMVGYTREDLQSGKLKWTMMTPPSYADLDRNALKEIQRSGAVVHPYEKEYIAKDGSHIPVLVGGTFINAAQGEIANFIIDIREQKRIEQELRKAKEQLEAILHNAADGITVHDAQGTLIYVNDVAATMVGFPSAEAMLSASLSTFQQILSKFILKDEEGNVLSFQDLPGRRAIQSKSNVQATIQYTDTLTGVVRWTLLKAQPIFDESEKVQFAVNVMTDISERQALEQRKNEFISMASHELKTPVTALKGFTRVLQRRITKYGDEQGLHYLQRMDAQLNKLTKLINDLLDISKIQAGKLVFQEEIFDLAALIREIVDSVQGMTTTHQLCIGEMEPMQVLGDEDRVGQVLINLLTNAIKYSPHADKVIVRTTTDGRQVTVSVQDFGIGIAPGYHAKIFEQFYQVTDPEEKTYPGLGIGLFITHEIIKHHKGRIWVESAKGQGSTFSFMLPLVPAIE